MITEPNVGIPSPSGLRTHQYEIFRQQLEKPFEVQIEDFEKCFGNLINDRYIVAVNAGTAALHLALRVLNIEPGDRVLCSSFSFVASANPIRYIGAHPVFVDSERLTWNIDPEMLLKAIEGEIKKGTRPKAIIIVHIYGMPAQLESIKSICNHYSIPIIEDAAQAIGSTVHNKMVGTIGDLGVYSFNNNKILTTMGGGALRCQNRHQMEFVKHLATQAKGDYDYYFHKTLGYNYRMSPINASYGVASMPDLESKLKARQEVYTWYRDNLTQLLDGKLQKQLEYTISNRWFNGVLFKNMDIHRISNLIVQGRQKGLEFHHLWNPLHLQPLYKDCSFYGTGTSEWLFHHGVTLPLLQDERHGYKVIDFLTSYFNTKN